MRVSTAATALFWFSLPIVSAGAPPPIVNPFRDTPIAFEENRGQFDPQVKFAARGSRSSLFLTASAALLTLRGSGGSASQLRMRPAGANRSVPVLGEDKQAGTSAYYFGRDPAAWRGGISRYGAVRYAGVYPGIDLVYYGRDGRLEYDFVVRSGSDPSGIAVEFEGAEDAYLDSNGDLILVTAAGEVRQSRPLAYQEAGGKRTVVEVSYRLGKKNRVTFELGGYDRSRTLVIDPILSWSTYLAGYGTNAVTALAVGPGGNVYVTGTTDSLDFPVVGGAPRPTLWGTDVFLAVLSPDGKKLLFSGYFGGTGTDRSVAVAVDPAGAAYVFGATDSADFPFTPGAFRTSIWDDMFVAKFDIVQSLLVYSAGLGYGKPAAMAVDATGNVFLCGTTSANPFFTTPGALQTVKGNGAEPFVRKLNPAGSALVYSTLMGGLGGGTATAIALGPSGNAYITGEASYWLPSFPVPPGGFQPFRKSAPEAYVANLNSTGSALIFFTFLGGSRADSPTAIAVDSSGGVYVAGATDSADFPVTAGAFRTTLPNLLAGFLTKLKPDGSGLSYSTYLGASGPNQPLPPYPLFPLLAVDALGSAHLAATTDAAGFPVTPGALQAGSGGRLDGVFFRLDSTGSSLLYSTYLGGALDDRVNALALDEKGDVYLAGSTASSNFPVTPGSFSEQLKSIDGFVLKVEMNGAACSYALSESGRSVGEGSGTGSFTMTVMDGCIWSVTSSKEWVKVVSGTRGSGNGAVTYTVDANVANVPRSAALNIAGMVYTINQEAATCKATLDQSTEWYTARGGLGSVGFSAPEGCTYDAASLAGFITLSPGGPFTRTGVWLFTVAPNGPGQRSGMIRVGDAYFTVIQLGAGSCTPLLPETGVSAKGMGGYYGFRVVINPECYWTPVSSADWISIYGPGEVQGSATVHPTVFANVGPPRTGTVNVAGQLFTITQETGECNIVFPPSPAPFSAYGVVGSVMADVVGTDCYAGNVVSSVDWMTITLTGLGSRGGIIQFYVAPNVSPNPRTGKITLVGKSYEITQNGADPTVPITYTISGQVVRYGGALSGVTVTLAGGPGGTRITDSSGNYSFANLPAGGNYTVTPAWADLTFTPPSWTFSNLLSSQSANFTGTAIPFVYAISGRVTSSGAGVQGVTVTLSGTQSGTVTTDATGAYRFPGLPTGGSCTVTPALSGYTFTPVNATFNNSTAYQTANFAANGPALAIGSLSPSFTIAGGGGAFTLTVNGSGFVSNSVVRWNGAARATTYVSVTRLTATITAADVVSVGTAQVTVFNSGGGTSNAATFTVQAAGAGLQFFPVTPCRVADTRSWVGYPAPFGPPGMARNSSRSFPLPASTYCGIPASAVAYSLNITAVPIGGPLGWLTVWPTGQPQPVVSTLNAWDGLITANAAIVPAGTGGAISVYASDPTEVFMDIDGYFAPPQSSSLEFYPVTPCRIADTRSWVGMAGVFGPPSLPQNGTRAFPVLSSSCAIPANAAAYSLNVTAVPTNKYLGWLTVWPTGQPQPGVSTLNAWDGLITANAAIVPAGTSGSISIYASDATDVFFDINGYFAPPQSAGLHFYPVTPCRVADTRSWAGMAGVFGPPTLAANSTRSFPLPSGPCGIPSTAAAYSVNITAVPTTKYLGWLSTWPAGTTQPVVSTLNAWDGLITANAAFVPAGPSSSISIYVSDPADVFFDINGYFAP